MTVGEQSIYNGVNSRATVKASLNEEQATVW